jgi:hypothetical protein
MITLPDTFLTYMRNMSDSLMTDTCTIEVQTDSYGDMGELIEGYSIVASGVSCRIIDASKGGEEEIEQQSHRETMVDEVILVVPYDTALAVDQRVTLSDGSKWFVAKLITSRTSLVDAQAIVTRIHG